MTTSGAKPLAKARQRVLSCASCSKIATRIAPRGVQTQAGGTLGAPKSSPQAPTSVQSADEAAERRPRGSQEALESSQKHPKSAQGQPKASQERRSCAQGRAQRRPNPCQNEPKEPQGTFRARPWQAARSERLPERCFAFSGVVCLACEACSDPIELWLCDMRSCRKA